MRSHACPIWICSSSHTCQHSCTLALILFHNRRNRQYLLLYLTSWRWSHHSDPSSPIWQKSRTVTSRFRKLSWVLNALFNLTNVFSLGKDTKISIEVFVNKYGKFTAGDIADLVALLEHESSPLERLDPQGSTIICGTLLHTEPCLAIERALYLMAVSTELLLRILFSSYSRLLYIQ